MSVLRRNIQPSTQFLLVTLKEVIGKQDWDY